MFISNLMELIISKFVKAVETCEICSSTVFIIIIIIIIIIYSKKHQSGNE